MTAAAFATALAGPLLGDGLRCDDPTFHVTGSDAATRERTCSVSGEARLKLATCGVEVNRPIRIELKDRVSGEISDCLGTYHCGEDLLELLTPDAMRAARANDGAFGAVSDTAFWESVIAHELTHAAYDRVHCPFPSCVATSEYAAYAMQVWTLPKKDRTMFGNGIELNTKPTRDAISAMIWYLAPDRFAVIAWQHFQARPSPCGYMQSIMDGGFFFDRERI